MPNFDKFNSFMNRKITNPKLYTYRYSVACVQDFEDTQLGKMNASISSVLSVEKRRQVKMRLSFVKEYAISNDLKLLKNTVVVLQALTRYADLDFSLTFKDIHQVRKELGMHYDTFHTQVTHLVGKGLLTYQEGKYYLTSKTHVLVTPSHDYADYKEAENDQYLRDYTFLTDMDFIRTLNANEHRLLYGLLEYTLLQKDFMHRRNMAAFYKLLNLNRNKGFSQKIEDQLEKNPDFQLTPNDFLMALIKFWKKGLLSFTITLPKNKEEANFIPSIKNGELSIHSLKEQGYSLLRSDLALQEYEGLNNEQIYEQFIQTFKAKTKFNQYFTQAFMKQTIFTVKMFHNTFEEHSNMATRTFVDNLVKHYTNCTFDELFADRSGLFNEAKNEYNLMVNMKKELAVISPLVACELFNSSITRLFIENHKTLPNKIMAEQAYNLFKDMYLLPNIEKLIIGEIKAWLMTYNTETPRPTSTTHDRQLNGPLSKIMGLSDLNLLIHYFAAKGNRKHFVSFVSALEDAIWESNVVQYQMDPHFVYDRITERFTAVTALLIEYVYKVRNLYKEIVIEMDAVEPINEDHFAEMLPAMQEMLGHTNRKIVSEYINRAHAEFTTIIKKLEVHNDVTAFNIKNLEKVQLLPLHMKKAHDYGIYKEYMDTTESMVASVFKVLAYAEELSQWDSSEENLMRIKNVQNDILYRFDKRSGEIIENLRYDGLESTTKQILQSFLEQANEQVENLQQQLAVYRTQVKADHSAII